MRIAQLSDWHVGITSPASIRKQIAKMVLAAPDIIVNCGDDSGGTWGAKGVRHVAKALRTAFPKTPILWVPGNHDFWALPAKKTFVQAQDFARNLAKLDEICAEFNILNLNQLPEGFVFQRVLFAGCSGWYRRPNPPTNDAHWGIKHADMSALMHASFLETLDGVKRQRHIRPDIRESVWVSHFPLIDDGTQGFADYGGSPQWGRVLQNEHGFHRFLNGHSHQYLTGPLQWVCGSDYYKPCFQIIEL